MEQLHTALPEDQGKIIRRKQFEHLYNHPSGVTLSQYRLWRVGDLEETLPIRKEQLQASLNGLKSQLTAMTGRSDFPSETSHAFSKPPADISDFGAPTRGLLHPVVKDRLSKQLNTLVERYKYTPETTVFRPSVAQSYLRSLVGLRNQVYRKTDKYLSNNCGEELAEGTTRAELIEAVEEFRQSMMEHSTLTQDKAIQMAEELDVISKIETKYDTMIESQIRTLYSKVKVARDEYQRLNEEQGTAESRVDSYRANADYYAATALLKERFSDLVDSSGRSTKSKQQDGELDIVAGKEYLDRAWELKHTEVKPVETLLEEMSIQPEQSSDVQVARQDGHETATAKPWRKSTNFNWADNDDDDEWWEEQLKGVGVDITETSDKDEASEDEGAADDGGSRLSAPTTKENVWFSSAPSSKYLFG
ncbi:hypothetical protein IAR50_006598 [Cryptococcus sp. DSM 104548]